MPRVQLIDDQGRPWQVLPRCEATVGPATRRFRDWCITATDHNCMARAKYVVDGEKLCHRHAGAKALEILLRESDATED